MAKKAMPEPEIEQPETDPELIVLPQNREAEEAVIGGVLRNPTRFPEAEAILKPADFFIRRNGLIWNAFENLTARAEPIDRLTIEQELQKMGKFEEVGGRDYLFGVEDNCPLGLHLPTYAQKVKEKAWRREVLSMLNETATQTFSDMKSHEDIANCLLEISEKATGNLQKNYVVRDAAYMLEPLQPVKYLVEGLIYEKSITVLYGDGGTKKTWAGLYLGACVASGNAWGDLNTTKTKVLYIDEEIGNSEMHLRGQQCIKGATLANDPIDLKYISLAGFHLDNPQHEAILTNEILAQGVGLVIFDALADLMLGDENSKQDTQPIFNALRRIVEKTGAAIVVIHHANKTGGYRGTSVIRDAPDIMCKVESDKDSNFINFEIEKNRKSKCVKWSMFATWAEDRFYLSHVEGQEKPKILGKAEDYVIRYLTDHGASQIMAIEGSADICSSGSARNAVYSLAKAGTIRRTNPSESKKVQAIYELKSNSIVIQEEDDNNESKP